MGGWFDYYDSGLDEHINRLKNELKYAKGQYDSAVIKELKKCLEYMELAELYMHRVDWFLSGDDGAENFLRRLKEDLAKNKAAPKIKPRARCCSDCKEYLPDSEGFKCKMHTDSVRYWKGMGNPMSTDTVKEYLEEEKNFQKDATKCFCFSIAGEK